MVYLSGVGNFLTLGHSNRSDLIEGTPILDIKPYIHEYDLVEDCITPEWVRSTPSLIQSVTWMETALKNLHRLLSGTYKLDFYSNFDDTKNAIEQVVRLDIPRLNYVRTHKQEEQTPQVHTFRLDNLVVEFKCEGHEGNVVDVHYKDEGKPLRKLQLRFFSC